MNKDNVISFENRELFEDPLTDLIRSGARQLIALGVEAELDELMAKYDGQHSEKRSSGGRSKRLPSATPDTHGHWFGDGEDSQGAFDHWRAGDVSLLPDSALCAKDTHVGGFVPWLYLKGISSGEMGEVLGVLLGQEAKGFSAGVVSRLKAEWEEEREQWMARKLSKERWVYLWVDGIYSGLAQRGGQVVFAGGDRRE